MSPWEFTKWWELHVLPLPSCKSTAVNATLSKWLPGKKLAPKPSDGWKFGRDYTWVDTLPPDIDHRIVRLRVSGAEAHFLVRRLEPAVPFPTLCPLPRPDDAQARFLNVYLRPWTLQTKFATLHVPTPAALDVAITDQLTARQTKRSLLGKQPCGPRGHAHAWKDYVRTHIVSQHALETIRNFLSAAECTPDEEDVAEENTNKPDQEVDTTWVDLRLVQDLTQGTGFTYSARGQEAVDSILQQWGDSTQPAEQPSQLNKHVGIPIVAGGFPVGKVFFAASGVETAGVATAYGKFTAQVARTWLHGLQNAIPGPRPSSEQSHFLQAVLERCILEATEEKQSNAFRSEPLRAFLHGVPGAGKTQTIKWLRFFFETVCEWTHGQEFVFAAPQNTQAALIDGITVHSLAGLTIKNKMPTASERSSAVDLFVKFQRLRWIVIDECSTLGLEVLSSLQKTVHDSTRNQHTWKLRAARETRPFGGINLLLAGDFWQFPAVKATSLFANPFKQNVSWGVRTMQKLIWDSSDKGMQNFFQLTVEHRCVDPWLSHVLRQARQGRMSRETCMVFPPRFSDATPGIVGSANKPHNLCATTVPAAAARAPGPRMSYMYNGKTAAPDRRG